MKLHPKIAELQQKMGTTPFWTGMNIETRKAKAETTDRNIKAYYCIFGEIDSYRTRWMKGAFKRSIDERGPKSSAKSKIPVLWMHDRSDPIGLPSILEEREEGLYAEFEPDDVPSGNRAVTQIRSGTVNNFSFGFNPIWEKMEYDYENDCINMLEAELLELSPVTLGANRNTHSVRGKDGEYEDMFLIEETEDFIRSIPRRQQLELRQLIDRHITLAKCSKPSETGSVDEVVDYDYLIKNLKLQK
jgi:uncharacterized protein